MKIEAYKRFVTIDPYNHTSYILENNVLKSYKSLKFNNKNFYISYLQVKDTIITTLEISRNIPPEDLRDVIEIKAYEELDLDEVNEYKIEFIEIPTPLHEKNRKFQLYITEIQIIRDVFREITKKIEYIDYILPAPVLFKSLYDEEILDNTEIHLFIYFQKDDAFVTLYSEGSLVYAKSLKYSFSDIAERISELKGENIDVQTIMQTLAKDGVKIADPDEIQFYMQVFSEIFMHINDILIYAKRVHKIEIVDKIFISSDIGYIKGIEEYSRTYLAQDAFDFNFDYPITSNEPYVEDLHFLLALSAKNIVERLERLPNLTIFHRPPPLWKRPSGHLLAITLVTLLLALAYPAYNFFLTYKLRYETTLLHNKYPLIHAKRVALETRINELKKQIKDIQNKIVREQQELQRIKNILLQIYNKKVHYVMKASTIAELSQDMVHHKINLINIDNNATSFDFNVTAVDNKNITRFIKYIADNKSDRYEVSTKEINKTDINSTVYVSNIEVKIK
ncbi:hypothetical protein [Nitratiruptor tergarcus]|uniref:Uncharacterized protein n=1 Tax=Nitratiruptor tergarcus DSM 16512 TaxID=1069081 RepID=A0A1W1WTW7_9BACT|nr:hypothetical protein [Nitratiruptor tergarcus]SMC09635.1 hypothetical protein SAMN05660197_1456 [Nitratiruptor tergarcus DSM 16512]